MTSKLFSNKNGNGALNLLLRAAFVICIFSVFGFAQTADKKLKTVEMPKVTQIDETNIAEILKPNGKPLLVNFWATWCVPCREEFPDLVKIDEEFKGKINVITISLDDLAEINRDVPKFLIEMKATMPTYLLYTNKESEVISSVSKDWQGGLPFSILYNANGEIIHTKQGKINLEIVRRKIFDLPSVLEKSESFLMGKRDAERDISENIIKVKGNRCGLREFPTIIGKRPKMVFEANGIEPDCISIFKEDEFEYAKGYNSISKIEIERRFGEEVLTEINQRVTILFNLQPKMNLKRRDEPKPENSAIIENSSNKFN